MYVGEDIKSNEVKIQTIFKEYNCVEIKFKMVIPYCGYVYRTPTKEKQDIVESTTRVCKVVVEAVERNNTRLIICGDFNYPSID